MLRNSEGETEILLGNKQLLGIFFVVAVLLGLAFAGGYKIGQGGKKAAAITSPAAEDAAAADAGHGGETHALPAEGTGSTATTDTAGSPAPSANTSSAVEPQSSGEAEAPLGARAAPSPVSQKSAPSQDSEAAGPPEPAAAPVQSARTASSAGASYTPQAGQTFLQVAAVSRDEAEGIADVLRKKSFRAHAVPKPGSAKIYRVLIGPIRDAADLNSTRASLRNTGFREIFVQRY